MMMVTKKVKASEHLKHLYDQNRNNLPRSIKTLKLLRTKGEDLEILGNTKHQKTNKSQSLVKRPSILRLPELRRVWITLEVSISVYGPLLDRK